VSARPNRSFYSLYLGYRISDQNLLLFAPILGVVDGFRSKGVETENDGEERKYFLRKIRYKM